MSNISNEEKDHVIKQIKVMEDTLSRVLVLESEMRELSENIPFGSTLIELVISGLYRARKENPERSKVSIIIPRSHIKGDDEISDLNMLYSINCIKIEPLYNGHNSLECKGYYVEYTVNKEE